MPAPSARNRWLAIIAAILLLAGGGFGVWYWRASHPSALPPAPPRHAAVVEPTPVEDSLLLLPIAFEPSALDEVALRVPRRIPIPARTHRKQYRWGSVSFKTDGQIRLSAITLNATDDGIVFGANADAELGAYVAGLRQTANALAAVVAKADLRVDADWRLQPRIELDYRWLQAPTTRVLGIDIDLQHEADKALRGRLPALEQRIAETLSERIDIRNQVERVWARTQQPIMVTENPPLWLAIDPLAIFLAPPESSDGTLTIMLGLQARLRLVHGAVPIAAVPKPLPAPHGGAMPEPGLRLNVDVEADYATMSASLSTLLRGHTQRVEHRGGSLGVTFEDFIVYPSTPVLVVGAKIRVDGIGWTDTTGWVYLTGTPRYDASLEQLLVENIDFVSATDHPLLQALSELMRERIRTQLAAAAHIDLRPRLARLRTDADTQLNRALDLALQSRKIDPRARELLAGRLQLSGRLTAVEVAAIGLAETALVVRVKVGADVSLQVR